jgi:hypothetical protein
MTFAHASAAETQPTTADGFRTAAGEYTDCATILQALRCVSKDATNESRCRWSVAQGPWGMVGVFQDTSNE